VLRNTTVLIGMHGAGLVNMVWLSEYASVIELFPYKYQKYTYKVIANVVPSLLPFLLTYELDLSYFSWLNGNLKNTVTHEEVFVDPPRTAQRYFSSSPCSHLPAYLTSLINWAVILPLLFGSLSR
jgi:hypothetical protein